MPAKKIKNITILVSSVFIFLLTVSSVNALHQGIPGDIDHDGDVDGVDFSYWLNNFGTTGPTSTPGDEPTDAPEPTNTPQPTSPSPTSGPSPTTPPSHGDWTKATGRPIDCPSDKATLFEVHTWWEDENFDDGEADDFGHIHAATCFPFDQSVGSNLDLDIRVTLHNNPSRFHKIRFDNQSGGLVGDISVPDLVCGVGKTCAHVFNTSLDTSKFKSSALRIRATTETPDGKRWVTSTDWQVAGGNMGVLQGKGWYGSPVDDYAIAQIDTDTIPRGPVSGTHVFRVKTKKASKRFRFWLNRQHHIPPVGNWRGQPHLDGLVIHDIQGDVKDWLEVPIDTTQLENGWHNIQVMSTNPDGEASQCSTCDNEIDLLSGGQKLWFLVQN